MRESRIILITGGARSGKSRYAEERVRSIPPPWGYVATAEARDEEMKERIRMHRSRRSADWRTVECPLQLAGALKSQEDSCNAQLVDCLTLWLSNLIEAERDVVAEVESLCHYLITTPIPVLLVTNEVGMGIVPANALAREFRDQAGRMNQAVARVAEEVILMVAGLPIRVKPSERLQ